MTDIGEFEVILTEKIIDGKLEVQYYMLPDDVSKENIQKASFDSEISNWVYVNYNVYHSGIIIFDGKASKIEENLWRIFTNNALNSEEGNVSLKLSEKYK